MAEDLKLSSRAQLADKIRRLERRVRELEGQLAEVRQPPQEDEARSLRYLSEHLPFYLAWKDRDLVYLGCNQNQAKAAGLASPADIVGMTDFDLPWTEAEAKLYQASDRRVIETGEPLIDRQATQHCADGTVMTIMTSTVPLRNAAQETIGVISLFVDVTERKRMEDALRESEARNRLILENIPALVAYIDREERFQYHNACCLALRGVSKEDLLGSRVCDVVEEPAYGVAQPHIGRALAGEPQRFETTVRDGKGELRELAVRYVPDQDNSGTVHGIYVLATDITERKRFERALAESEARLRTIVESAPVEIYLKDREGRHLMVGHESRRRFGRDLHGLTAHEFLPQDVADKLVEQDQEVLRTGEVVPLEYHLDLPEGVRHFMAIKFPVPSGDGDETIVGGVAIDITDRKRFELALKESEARLQAIVDHAPVEIYLKDRRGHHLVSGREARAQFGQDIYGLTAHDLFAPELADDLVEQDEKVLRTGSVVPLEYQRMQADGLHHYVAIKFPVPSGAQDEAIVGGVAIDITEQKKAEVALRASEEEAVASRNLLLDALDAMRDGMAFYDADDRLIFCNQRCRDMYPVIADLLVPGTRWGDLLRALHERGGLAGSPDQQQKTLTARRESRRGQEITEYQLSDGRWVQGRDQRTASGGMVSVRIDITERKAFELALQKSEAQLQAFVEFAPVQIYLKDRQGRHLLAGRESRRYFKRDIRGLTAHEHLPADIAEALEARDKEVLETGAVASMEYELRQDDGPHQYVTMKFPVPSGEQDEVIVGGVAIDITEQKKAEAALRASEEEAVTSRNLLVDALEAMRDGMAFYDSDDRLIFCNRRFRDMCPCASDLMVPGTRWEDLIQAMYQRDGFAGSEEEQRAAYERRLEARRKGEVGEYQTRTGRWVQTRDHRKEGGGLVSVRIDITERKEAEQALHEAKEHAERANLAKSRFLAAASHDMRQPLQALRLLMSVLETTPSARERRQILKDMTGAVDAMGDLLNALLDISKLEAGAVSPELSQFSIQRSLDRIRRDFQAQAQSKGLDFRVLPCAAVVHSDPVLVDRILSNLVANAVQYTETGRILVGCRSHGPHLRVEVWDSGIGIPQDQLGNVFEEFHQLENPARDRTKGLGLGLAIVKRLANLLDLPLDVRSVPSSGSVFSIEIPRRLAVHRPARQAQRPAAAKPELGKIAILVIEDDAAVAAAMGRLLSRWGAEVRLVDSYAAAIAEFSGAGYQPDLIISDYRLPGRHSGIAALKGIEQRLGRRVPSIVITGDSQPQSMAVAEAAGYRLLHKPVDPRELEREIRRLAPDPQDREGGPRYPRT
ncbi:MAG: PAS domain-containing protein [Alphaproteobacteria bacterium]|nr:PAS domain-containing protein [Alphaproteobacteria bacterium]